MFGFPKRGWKTKAQAECSKILNGSPLNTPLGEDEHAVLHFMLELHPEAEDKIGCGVSHFEVRQNAVYPNNTFWLVRFDGTETDFSYMKCGSKRNEWLDFQKACRTAVVDSILAFKNSIFDSMQAVVCPIHGVEVTRDTAHIDHAPPWEFRKIAMAWAETLLNPFALVAPTRDGEVETYFANKSDAEAFRKFHDARAILRVLSRRANLSDMNRRKQ